MQQNPDGSKRFEIQANDGYGVKMWLLEQGAHLKIISPQSIKDYVIADMLKNLKRYGIVFEDGS